MKLDPELRPELCVSKDEYRPALTQPHLDTKRKAVVSTDGYSITSLTVEIEKGDRSGPLPLKALSMAREERKATEDGKVLVSLSATRDAAALESGITIPRPKGWKFPEWERCVPDKKKLTGRLCLDASFLENIARAIGAPAQVLIEFDPKDPMSPVVIRPAWPKDGNGSFGVLMPVRTREIALAEKAKAAKGARK